MSGNEAFITGVGQDDGLFPVDKLQAHIDGTLHLAVSIFLINEKGELLLQRRALGKYHSAGLWANSCCSHPLFGESLEVCAYRRMQEELGLVVDLKVINQIDYRCQVGDMVEHERVTWFRGFLPSKEEIKFNAEEVSEVRWISMKELEIESKQPNQLANWLNEYLSAGLVDMLKLSL